MPFTKKSFYKKGDKWIVDTVIKRQGVRHRIYRVLGTNKDAATITANALVANIKAGRFDAVKSTSQRQGYATIGEVAEVYRAAENFEMKPRQRGENLSALRRLIRTALNKPKMSDDAINRLSTGILNEDLVERYKANARKTWLPAIYSYNRRLPDEMPVAGELKGKDKELVWRRINSYLIWARTVFATERMHPKRGIYQKTSLPDLTSFLEAVGVKANERSPVYLPPDDDEISLILGMLPALKANEVELGYCIDNNARKLKGDRVYLAIIIAISTGMRIGEIAAFRWDWLKKISGKWYCAITTTDTFEGTKAKQDRTIPMPPDVIDELFEMKADSRFVISGGDYYRGRLMAREVAVLMRDCGWKRAQCCHELRAIWASDLASTEDANGNTPDALTIMEAGGWNDLLTARRYMKKNTLPTYDTSRRLKGIRKEVRRVA